LKEEKEYEQQVEKVLKQLLFVLLIVFVQVETFKLDDTYTNKHTHTYTDTHTHFLPRSWGSFCI